LGYAESHSSDSEVPSTPPLLLLQTFSSTDAIKQTNAQRGEGLKRLEEIVLEDFEVEAGNRSDKTSFQRVIVPLIVLLSRPDFVHSPYNHASLSTIYSLVFSSFGENDDCIGTQEMLPVKK